MTGMAMPIYVSIFSQELMLRREQLVMTSQIGKHKREVLVILFPDKQPIILNMTLPIPSILLMEKMRKITIWQTTLFHKKANRFPE